MKTVGEFIKSARVKKKYSLKKLEEITKIKSIFLSAIERSEWNDLPNLSTTLGFVRSIAGALKIDEKSAVALFKRDYVPKKQLLSPKPAVFSKFVWSPKKTFLLAIFLLILGVFGYLGTQFINFSSPPSLTIDTPHDNEVVVGKFVVVSGTTSADAKIVVNNQPVLVDQNGKFLVGLEVSSDTKEIVITATGRSGKMTEVRKKILVTND